MIQFSNTALKKLFLVLFAGLIFAMPVYAQIIPCGPQVENPEDKKCTVEHFFDLLVNIYNFLLGIAAFVAMLIIIVSGITMLIYHYFENPEQVLTGAKFTFTRALFGFAIIAMAYLIVNTVLTLLGINTSSAVGGFLSRYLGF